VEIRAAALNHLDLWIRRGLPGLKIPLPHIPGSDAAGVIREVGSNVSAWKAGDRVVVQPGTFCGSCPACQAGEENMCRRYGILGETQPGVQQQYLALDQVNVGTIPEHLSFAAAAAIPLAAFTAWQMLTKRAALKAGETLLVIGASSGVGSFAIQMGKHLGARIIATAGSESKRDHALALGADAVLNQHQTGFSREVRNMTSGEGADVIFEHVGTAVWDDCVKALAWGGRLVTCGATTGVKASVNLRHLFYKRQSILGSTMGSLDDFNSVMTLAQEKIITPVIDRVFSFGGVRDAHRHLEEQHGFGKVILEGCD